MLRALALGLLMLAGHAAHAADSRILGDTTNQPIGNVGDALKITCVSGCSGAAANSGTSSVELTSGTMPSRPIWIVWQGTTPVAVINSTVSLNGLDLLATAAAQGTSNTHLANILAKIISAPATEAKQDTGNTSLAALVTQMQAVNRVAFSSGSVGAPFFVLPIGGLPVYSTSTLMFIINGTSGSFVNPYYFLSTATLNFNLISSGTSANPLYVAFPSAQSVTGPLTDTQLRASALPISAASLPLPTGAATEATLALVKTGVDKSTIVIQGSNGSVVTVTGNSLNVNCTGGCGTASQAVTWLAYSTSVALANRYHFVLMNGASSAKTVKILNIAIGQLSDAAVTGIVLPFKLYTIASFAGGVSTAPVRAADTSDGAFPPDNNITRGSAVTSVTVQAGPLASVNVSTEETALQPTPKDLYHYDASGGKPLTLRPGQGIAIQEGNLTGAAGTVSIAVEFTTE